MLVTMLSACIHSKNSFWYVLTLVLNEKFFTLISDNGKGNLNLKLRAPEKSGLNLKKKLLSSQY